MPLGNGVARDELAYWETFLGKTKISLDDARMQGYALLGGTGKSVNDLERSALIAQLGLTTLTAAKLTLNDLRYKYYSGQLGNPTKQGMQDVTANFWKTSGFAPQFTLSFRDTKVESTAAAQTKTLSMNMVPALATRSVIVGMSWTGTAALPSPPTLGGFAPSTYWVNNNSTGRYTAIGVYQQPNGTSANLVFDAGAGNTVANVFATSSSTDKQCDIVSHVNSIVAVGANTLNVAIPNVGWKLGDFVSIVTSVTGASVSDMVSTPPGFVYETAFAVGSFNHAGGDQVGIPNNNPYNVLLTFSAGATTEPIAQGVRLRIGG